jgi:hypothetical protein
MSRTIRIDGEVYAWLQQHARPFEDNPNSVLRRIAGLDGSGISTSPSTAGPSKGKSNSNRGVGTSNMSTVVKKKFDEIDRQRAIRSVEQFYRTKLTKRGRRRKSLISSEGSQYWVLGGYEDWHGIPADMIEEVDESDEDGKLIVAKMTDTQILIYSCALLPIVHGLKEISSTQKGDRQFNLVKRGGKLCVKEMPTVVFELLTEVDYAQKDRIHEESLIEAQRLMSTMSRDELKAFRKSLQAKTD